MILFAATALSLVQTLGALTESSGTRPVATDTHASAAVVHMSRGHCLAELRISELAASLGRQLTGIYLVAVTIHEVVIVLCLLYELLSSLTLRSVCLSCKFVGQMR